MKLHLLKRLTQLAVVVSSLGLVVSTTETLVLSSPTWTSVTSPLPASASAEYTDLAVDSDGSVVVLSGYRDYIYVSTDSGATFTKPQTSTGQLNAIIRDWKAVDVSKGPSMRSITSPTTSGTAATKLSVTYTILKHKQVSPKSTKKLNAFTKNRIYFSMKMCFTANNP